VQDKTSEFYTCDSSLGSSISGIPASQQIYCSSKELLKAPYPYGKHNNYGMNLISHLQYFTNMIICELY
jgi:hypothetical protein